MSMNIDNIHQLICKYFDAETSLEEERWLRSHLPGLAGTDPEIDEALAVMGYAAGIPRATTTAVRRRLRTAAAVAATLTLLLAAGGTCLYFSHRNPDPQLVAYSGGVRLDPQEAMRLIEAQMEEMGDASKSIELEVIDDFKDFRHALN